MGWAQLARRTAGNFTKFRSRERAPVMLLHGRVQRLAAPGRVREELHRRHEGRRHRRRDGSHLGHVLLNAVPEHSSSSSEITTLCNALHRLQSLAAPPRGARSGSSGGPRRTRPCSGSSKTGRPARPGARGAWGPAGPGCACAPSTSRPGAPASQLHYVAFLAECSIGSLCVFPRSSVTTSGSRAPARPPGGPGGAGPGARAPGRSAARAAGSPARAAAASAAGAAAGCGPCVLRFTRIFPCKKMHDPT